MDDLRNLILALTGVLAGDENGCAWTGMAAELVKAVEAVVERFAVLVPDSDESVNP